MQSSRAEEEMEEQVLDFFFGMSCYITIFLICIGLFC
jgi:hypothetical protein